MTSKMIWKYDLELNQLFDNGVTIEIPGGSEILCVQMQNDKVCIWVLWTRALLNVKIKRLFRAYGTGHDITVDSLEYLGTIQDGAFVWHIFEDLSFR